MFNNPTTCYPTSQVINPFPNPNCKYKYSAFRRGKSTILSEIKLAYTIFRRILSLSSIWIERLVVSGIIYNRSSLLEKYGLLPGVIFEYLVYLNNLCLHNHYCIVIWGQETNGIKIL